MKTPATHQSIPSYRFTGILAAALCIPFAVTLLITEPYPAVIMPSGSGKLDLSDGTYQFVHYRAYGIDATGAKEPLDLLELTQAAHPQYLYVIFSNHFGLNRNSQKELKLRGTDLQIARYRQPGATSAHQAVYREQLHSRFNQQYTALQLEKVSVTGDIETRTWITEETDELIIIQL